MRFIAFSFLLFALLTLFGCANTMKAIENRSLAVAVKMSETIFLDPVALSAAPKIYVRVTNTSDMQDIDFGSALRGKLRDMGYAVTSVPAEAQYYITANVLFMGENKSNLDMNSVVNSGFGAALAGGAVAGASGRNFRQSSGAGLAVGAAAAGTEAISGMMFRVKEYVGVVDLQIMEQVAGGVRGTETAIVSSGSATTRTVEREIQSNFQEYRVRIGVSAKQTNMNHEEAIIAISERLRDQICGVFGF